MMKIVGFRVVFSTALTFGVALALAVGSIANAEIIVKDQGTHGEAHIFDSSGFPGAKCGYGPENASHQAFLSWIKVFGVKVTAADRTSGVDHQPVSFQVQIQRKKGAGPWKVFANSQRVTKTAADDAFTSFKAIKVYINNHSVNSQVFRAAVILRWMRNGSVDGLVKAQIEWYSVLWTVGDPAYVFDGSCTSWAD
jgi:hypothetical protein